MMKQILPLDPLHYQRHLLHGDDRNWVETNCYVDVWIELLHAWGIEPIAALAFCLAIDFEGDQWTFFKFPHSDLKDLYSIDVQELAIWKPLTEHIEEQVARGRPVLVELDSYYLPDTAGTAYQRAHTKSTVAINEIDLENKQLGYFHNQAYHLLRGADFINVFHMQGPADPARMPPYVEFVKFSRAAALNRSELVSKSLALLRKHLHGLGTHNPFEDYKARLQSDLAWLQTETIDTFHQYSFATLRQFGACYELFATYLAWLHNHSVRELQLPISAFSELATGAKTLQFQLARTMTRKKPLNLSVLDSMAAQWTSGVESLRSIFG